MIVYVKIYRISSTSQIDSLYETNVDIYNHNNYIFGYIDINEIEFVSDVPEDKDTLGIVVLKSGNIYYLNKYDIDEILFEMYENNPEKCYPLKVEYGTEIDKEERLKRLDVTL